MTRALNLYASQQEVAAACSKHKADVTSIETLPSGGTRVVLRTGDSAAIIARAFKNNHINGTITRAPLRTMRSG